MQTISTEILKYKQRLITEASPWRVSVIIFLSYSFITWFSQEFIYDESIYYRSYSETLTQQAVENMFSIQSRFWWLSYTFIPLVLLLKFLFTSICISIGAVISAIDINFKKVFKAALISEGVFVIAQAVLIILLYMNLDSLTLQNASGYFPLSALSLIGIENVNAQWAIYPLQTANLFEVFYVIAISWLLSKQWKPDFVESLNIVIPSYGLGLLLWVVLVAFLTLQIS